MLIIKRDKRAQTLDLSKLHASLSKVFQATNTELTIEDWNTISSYIKTKDGMTTNDLQTQVENILMKLGYLEQARYFIIYRHLNYHEKSQASKIRFMREYLGASNAATGSKYDPNANVTVKNLTTLTGELFKGDTIKLNRYRLYHKIEEMFGKDLADEYIRQIESHEIYKHDESSILPYCVSVTMYPYLLQGLTPLGGLSLAPKNLDSFCGGFINLMFAVASQFAGAVSSPEFLMYFDYFARKEWGNDYYRNPTRITRFKYRDGNPNGVGVTIDKQIEQYFQQVVYSINQPAASRSYQSIFWNIGYFDRFYFQGMFEDFYFPDGTSPRWESLEWLQRKFMKWFNKERTKEVITFPVESFSLLVDKDTNTYKDSKSAEFVAEMYSEGHSFFTYVSDNPDALSSCCRLRNEVTENQFSFSLGAGGVATGSKSVITINLNRCIQNAVKAGINHLDYLREQVKKVHKYQIAFNELLKEFLSQGALPVYDAGFIHMDKQYLTVGVNGGVEAAEFLGIKVGCNQEYKEFISGILEVFYEENKKAKKENPEVMFNTEFVPAENLGVKFYKWDKKDGYVVPEGRNCYNSYFYVVEDPNTTVLDKFRLHGRDFVSKLDGGSALHCNLDAHLSKAQYQHLLEFAAKEGTNYFTFNIPNTICNECGHIDKRYLKECPKCGSKNIDYATRIIGYLKRISNFSEARQEEAERRSYSNFN